MTSILICQMTSLHGHRTLITTSCSCVVVTGIGVFIIPHDCRTQKHPLRVNSEMPGLEMPTKPIDRVKPGIISIFKSVLDGKGDFSEKHLIPGVLISALLLEQSQG